MTIHQLVFVYSLRTVRWRNRGSSGNCSFYLLHPRLVLKDMHKIFLALDISLEERHFYHSALYWVPLVGTLVTSAFLLHEANEDLQ